MPLPGLLMNRPLEWETQRGVSDHRPPPPPWGLTMSVDLPLGPGKHSHFPVTWSDRPDKPPSHNCGQFIYLDPITALGRGGGGGGGRSSPGHRRRGWERRCGLRSACVRVPRDRQTGQRASVTPTRSAWENCPKPQCLQCFSARGWVAGYI
uniref:Uncharacterized protein n=1 Tax=Felis catus TaxID=9685 RepID=A0ABI8A304_FELCA